MIILDPDEKLPASFRIGKCKLILAHIDEIQKFASSRMNTAVKKPR